MVHSFKLWLGVCTIINLCINFLSILRRFAGGQDIVMKGMMLVPATLISDPNSLTLVKQFIEHYEEDLPSPSTVDAELVLWHQLWTRKWEDHWKCLLEQQSGTGTTLSATERDLQKLKELAVPNTITSALQLETVIFPNIHRLLTILAVLPVTTCEVERTISSLRRLKTYVQSTMMEDRLTGLALMHIHSDLDVNIDDIINTFAIAHPHRMKLSNILND